MTFNELYTQFLTRESDWYQMVHWIPDKSPTTATVWRTVKYYKDITEESYVQQSHRREQALDRFHKIMTRGGYRE